MNISSLTFRSLTVLDFFEESKAWKEEDFISNCQIHKRELEEIRILRKHHRYYGCKMEVEHLIGFLRNLLWFNSNSHYPATMKEDDYKLMIEIFQRYNPNLEWK